MKELIKHKDRAVVIVSHDRKTVGELCNKVLWLDNGEIIRFGPAKEVLAAYDAYVS